MRLNLSAAIFQTDYNGIQLNFQEGVSPTSRNAGDAKLKGAELQANAAITDALTVSGRPSVTPMPATRPSRRR